MAEFIIRLNREGRDWYLVWSTVVDAPITRGISRDELIRTWRTSELGNMSERMARVDAKGTSSLRDANVDETIGCNRAGPEETRATKDEIIDWYCLDITKPRKASKKRLREQKREDE